MSRAATMENLSPDSGTIVLANGGAIHYRPILASDRAALQRFHGRHSDVSIYLRFFAMQRTLGDAQARDFTELDGVDRFALVAVLPADPDEIIGVARFDREPGTGRAEYAAIVADAWQGRGLGLQLTLRLIEAAKRRGVAVLCAYVLPQNLRMLNLLRGLGLPETVRFEDGVERIDVDLLGRALPATGRDGFDDVETKPRLRPPGVSSNRQSDPGADPQPWAARRRLKDSTLGHGR